MFEKYDSTEVILFIKIVKKNEPENKNVCVFLTDFPMSLC